MKRMDPFLLLSVVCFVSLFLFWYFFTSLTCSLDVEIEGIHFLENLVTPRTWHVVLQLEKLLAPCFKVVHMLEGIITTSCEN